MPTQLADLDELVLCCRSETARDYIGEAVRCYRSGAFRACILSTWVAVVYDFVEKFRELSIGGDKQAKDILDKYESIHSSGDLDEALKFERTLLSVCKDSFELITPQEFIDLERLQKDRNRCAHPNLIRLGEIYLATPELARSHLRNAVEHLLQRPPKVGKAAVDQLFREVQSDYFPVDPKQAIEVLKRGPLAFPKDNLLREFLLGITSAALSGDLSIQEVSKRFSAIRATFDFHREKSLGLVKTHFPKVLEKTPDTGLKYLLALLARLPDIETAIYSGLQARLFRYIEICPSGELCVVLNAAFRTELFKERASNRVATLDEDSVIAYLASRSSVIPVPIVVRSIILYGSSLSFADANKKAENLIFPILSQLTREHVLMIFDIAGKNDHVVGSFAFIEFLDKSTQLGCFSKNNLIEEIKKRKWEKRFNHILEDSFDFNNDSCDSTESKGD